MSADAVRSGARRSRASLDLKRCALPEHSGAPPSGRPVLLTPGPLALSAEVKEEMLVDLGSRSARMREITARIRSSLLRLTGAEETHEAVPIQGSGSFATEAVLSTFVSPSDVVLVVVSGVYGERIVQILERRGIRHRILACDPISLPDPTAIAEILSSDTAITHLCIVQCETTTGLLLSVEKYSCVARAHGVITIVDAMSAFGAVPIDARRDGFDVLIGSGNKCVEAPPGVAFALVQRGLLTRKTARSNSFCLDLYEQWSTLEQSGEWRSTPPTHVLQALRAALESLEVETVAGRAARYAAIRDQVVDGMSRLGFVPLLPAPLRSPVCVAFTCPDWAGREARAFEVFYRYLDEAGIEIYSKLHLPTRSFRIGCIGRIEPHWIELFLDRVERFPSARAFAVSAA